MKGPLGYGRYDDDPEYVGCSRASTDMTPCIARDGAVALADDNKCVGCNQAPRMLLNEIRTHLGQPADTSVKPAAAADQLVPAVLDLTEPLVPKSRR